jgi:hypothetical protein
MSPARRPPYSSSPGPRCGDATASVLASAACIWLAFGWVALDVPRTFDLPLAFGLAAAFGCTAASAGVAALLAAVFGRGAAGWVRVRAGLAFGAGRAMLPAAAAVADIAAVPALAVPDLAGALFGLLAVAGFGAVFALGLGAVFALAAVPDLVPVFGAVAATDLTAAVSELAAVVRALVAVFIACMAVDIVLAEDVALVAAAVILVAADVTLVAAVETVRAAAAGAAAELLRAAAGDLAPVAAFVVECRAARLGMLPLADPVRAAVAGLRRTAVPVVVRAGTDLPPSRSITEVLFHE